MDVMELPSVASSVERLRELLHRASQIKPKPDIEPPLPISEYSGEKGLPSEIDNKSSQHAVIEATARQLFLQFLTNSSSVDDAEFVHVWNLLDILNILGDQGTRTFLQ
jgi:THO complex subunit 1